MLGGYVKSSGDYDYTLDRHTAETIYYAGDMPSDISEMEIEW